MSQISRYFANREKHGFHLVENSQLPVLTALLVFILAFGIILYWNPIDSWCGTFLDRIILKFGFVGLNLVLFSWFLKILQESGEGYHTFVVRRGIRLGIILFIISEIMLFFSFFWAFFHVSLAPAISLGCVWPPHSIQALDVWGLPLTNTLLLLSSGVSLTLAHQALLDEDSFLTEVHLFTTIVLGLTFLCCQFIEYKYGITFSWSETVYGSSFFVTTGFHGLHVSLGTIFLIFCLIRSMITTIRVEWNNGSDQSLLKIMNSLSTYSFRKEQHIGFEAAAWYWHFVDVVWIFLFITVYWWGS